jgi:hypothetical protein
MRREHMLLPHRDTLMEAKDRLVLIVSPESREPLARFITPISEAQGNSGQQALTGISAAERP